MCSQHAKEWKDYRYLEYYDYLKRYSCFLSRNKWDGEDIAQEAMLRVIQSYGDKQEVKQSLLKRIAYNYYIDLVRKRKFECMDFAENMHELNQEKYLVNDALELLKGRLTAKQTVIFILKKVFLYQIKEIASIMSTTEYAVKSSLYRTKKRLEKLDDEHCADQSFAEDEESRLLFDAITISIQQQDPTVLLAIIPKLSLLEKEISGMKAVLPLNKHFNTPTLKIAV